MILFLFKMLTLYLSWIFSINFEFLKKLKNIFHDEGGFGTPLNFVSEADNPGLIPSPSLILTIALKDCNSLSYVIKSGYQSQVI